MREFWDSRADEDAFYFVDNRLRYRDPDVEEFWAGGGKVLEAVLGMLQVALEPDDDVVEIGCGVGRITRALADRAAEVRALDVSERMLARARELNPALDNVNWLLGDGTTLSGIEDTSADVCFPTSSSSTSPTPRSPSATCARWGGFCGREGGLRSRSPTTPRFIGAGRSPNGSSARCVRRQDAGRAASPIPHGSARRSRCRPCRRLPASPVWPSSARLARGPSSATCCCAGLS